MAVKPIPEGFHTLTPHIIVNDAAKAIDFYKKAFSAEEVLRLPGPGGKIMHAEIKIGDSPVMIAEEYPDMGVRSPLAIGGSAVTLNLYVPDVDKVFNQAVSAGATAAMPVADQFWGDRYGKLTDPFGHHWSVATHTEDLTAEQIAERAQAAFSQGASS
jgi:uncharacterized glyoxalase superfamily protein PhnB